MVSVRVSDTPTLPFPLNPAGRGVEQWRGLSVSYMMEPASVRYAPTSTVRMTPTAKVYYELEY